jgi:hypothetical protein
MGGGQWYAVGNNKKKQQGTVFSLFAAVPSLLHLLALYVITRGCSCFFLLASRLGAIVIHLPKIHGAGTRKAIVSGGQL